MEAFEVHKTIKSGKQYLNEQWNLQLKLIFKFL